MPLKKIRIRFLFYFGIGVLLFFGSIYNLIRTILGIVSEYEANYLRVVLNCATGLILILISYKLEEKEKLKWTDILFVFGISFIANWIINLFY
jgi:hypothetical protein